MGCSVLFGGWRSIFHRWTSSLSVQFSPLWYSFLKTLVCLVSLKFLTSPPEIRQFPELCLDSWFPHLVLQPGKSEGSKMLHCSVHLICLPFLQDHCFCCLILSDLKTTLSYIYIFYNMINPVLGTLSWSRVKHEVLLYINLLK